MNKEDQKVGRYEYVAEPFHVDFKGNLTLPILGNHFLNCASFHSSDRGFGIAKLNEENYTWVLSRLAIELEDLPKEYESFSITTWVENVYRLFTDRNFTIYNQDNQCIGYACSVWAMISKETRKPANLVELHGNDLENYIYKKSCPIEKPSRIKVLSQEVCSIHKVKYTDIDINGHVNSIKYMEYVLDLFPIDKYKNQGVKRFEIAYVAESYYGDELSFYVDSTEDSEYCIEVKRKENIVVCRAKVLFNKLKQE